MAVTLTPPSAEKAKEMLRELGWEERFTGHRMSPVTGNAPTDLYNLKSVAEFIHLGKGPQLLVRGTRAHIGYVDPGKLSAWLRDTLDDEELAAAIDEVAASYTNPWTVLEPIGELVNERYAQCVAALEGADA